jgi:nucleoside-diphosphate-sugar epimerase
MATPLTEAWWSARRVLITGISGFVGRHLARRLVDLDASVIGLDVPLRSVDYLVLYTHGRFDFEAGNVLNRDDLRASLREHRPEVIYHLAGVSLIESGRTTDGAASMVHVNVLGTANLLDACARFAPDARVVVASSNHIYGSGPQAVTEDAPCAALDVYGASKACADHLTRAYATAFGLPAVTLRHVNAYGPADPHMSHLVPGTIAALLRGERPVIRGDGTARKGYLYIADVVDAYLCLAQRAADVEVAGRGYNAGSPPVSVAEMVAEIVAISGTGYEPVIAGTDLGQSGYVESLDDTRLRRLGWRPSVSLRDGLRLTWAWYAERRRAPLPAEAERRA